MYIIHNVNTNRPAAVSENDRGTRKLILCESCQGDERALPHLRLIIIHHQIILRISKKMTKSISRDSCCDKPPLTLSYVLLDIEEVCHIGSLRRTLSRFLSSFGTESGPGQGRYLVSPIGKCLGMVKRDEIAGR